MLQKLRFPCRRRPKTRPMAVSERPFHQDWSARVESEAKAVRLKTAQCLENPQAIEFAGMPGSLGEACHMCVKRMKQNWLPGEAFPPHGLNKLHNPDATQRALVEPEIRGNGEGLCQAVRG